MFPCDEVAVQLVIALVQNEEAQFCIVEAVAERTAIHLVASVVYAVGVVSQIRFSPIMSMPVSA